jgi:hypothetical protein
MTRKHVNLHVFVERECLNFDLRTTHAVEDFDTDPDVLYEAEP